MQYMIYPTNMILIVDNSWGRRCMMKNWTFRKHLLLSVAITGTVYFGIFVSYVFSFSKLIGLDNLFEKNEAASIAIIGGADGPTAVFATGNTLYMFLLNKYVLLFFVLLLSFIPMKWLLNRHFRDKEI